MKKNIQTEAQIIEKIGRRVFKILLPNGAEIIGFLKSKNPKSLQKMREGANVLVEIQLSDFSKAEILKIIEK